MAIPLFTRLIHAGTPLTIYGDGSTRRDFTHVSDVVDGILRILKNNLGYQIYNLGTGKTVILRDMIKIISEHLGHDQMPEMEFRDFGAGEAVITYADITKARKILGYSPKMEIREGLKEYVNWYLKEKGYAI